MDPSVLAKFDGILVDGFEFCARAYGLFEEVRSPPGGTSRLRRRSSRAEKKLLEELLPICKYLQANIKPGRYISVRWVDGSQRYDAELVQRGSLIDHGFFPATCFLEVTSAMHPNDHLHRELLDTVGSSFGPAGLRRTKNRNIESQPVGPTNRDFVEYFASIVVTQLGKKAAIHYPNDTSLVVECKLNRLYMPDEWADLIARVRAALPPSSFHEIYLYDPVCNYAQALFPRSAGGPVAQADGFTAA